nr:hypothetical protein CJ183_11215 [Acinetobacter ursingii]
MSRFLSSVPFISPYRKNKEGLNHDERSLINSQIHLEYFRYFIEIKLIQVELFKTRILFMFYFDIDCIKSDKNFLCTRQK